LASGGAYMKHHLLQNCSFFLIKLTAVQASGRAEMKKNHQYADGKRLAG
jgi:hypothetical protein